MGIRAVRLHGTIRLGENGPHAPNLDRERACPPEDSGGVGGYYDKLLTLRDPDHDDYESTRVWVESMTGGPFDPEVFDLAAANRAIEALR